MYRPNDVLFNGQRISNIFNTQDEDWHQKYMRPIRGLWTMSKILEYEPLIDETLNKFLKKLDTNFVEGEKVCPAHDWLAYCMGFCSGEEHWLIRDSCLGCYCKYQLRPALRFHRSREGCGQSYH